MGNKFENMMMDIAFNLTSPDMTCILVEKGDMDIPSYIPRNIRSFRSDKEKAAMRRKATIKKGIQREKLLRNKGYSIDNLDEADKGLIRGGVGPCFEAMHMDKMYFHGNKQEAKKHITPQMAMNMLAEDEEANQILIDEEYKVVLERERWENRLRMKEKLRERKESLSNLEDSIRDLEFDILLAEEALANLEDMRDNLLMRKVSLQGLINCIEEELGK